MGGGVVVVVGDWLDLVGLMSGGRYIWLKG